MRGIVSLEMVLGLTQNITKVAVIHELPLRLNKTFGHILRKSWVYWHSFFKWV